MLCVTMWQSVHTPADMGCVSRCSSREIERGDRVVWGTTGNNQIGILHPGALPVRYEYDTVLDEYCTNQQVS